MHEKLGSFVACFSSGCFAFLSSTLKGIEQYGAVTVGAVALAYVSYKLFCRNNQLQDRRIKDFESRLSDKDTTITHLRKELDAEKSQKTELIELLKTARRTSKGLPPSVNKQINNVTNEDQSNATG